jgi:GT2 family glycosyltransferase
LSSTEAGAGRDGQRRSARLREAEAERDELEAELAARGAELRAARRRALDQIGRLEDDAAVTERRLEAAVAARASAEADVEEVRSALEAALDVTRAERNAAQRAEQTVRRRLVELQEELSESSVQRQRLQSALAGARADAEAAEAERAASERRRDELVAELAQARRLGPHPSYDLQQQLERLLDELRGVLDERDDLARRLAQATADGRLTLAPPRPVNQLAPVSAATGPVETAVEEAGRPAEPSVAPAEDFPAGSRWPPLPDVEREVQANFLADYGAVAEPPPGRPDERDPVALPSPVDRRGVLAAPGEVQEPGAPSVDVVVCVHDALEDLRLCLWSLVAKAGRRFGLIVVNDGSDAPTSEFLTAWAALTPAARLIHRPDPPHGYTTAANAGLRASDADYVVLLNSDTIVTPGWLESIVACGEADERLGVLGPLSNAASHQSVPEIRDAGVWATNPLPSWLTADGMALIVARSAPRTRARPPFINGFCYAVKRRVIDAIGYLDEERFATGYCEENDFSQRARLAGFELGVVDDAYVYHAKSRSFGVEGRRGLAKRNYQVFLAKHGREEIDRLVGELEADQTLAPVRAAVRAAIAEPAGARAAISAGRRPLSIVFVLPGLGDGGSGGSHSIYQEVKGMRQLGIPARIALFGKAFKRALSVYEDAEEIFEPFTGDDELAARTEQADVVSATHFKSVAMLRRLHGRRQDFLPAYYVQDYEPFFSAGGAADVAEAFESYTAIPDMLLFAKTHWLCNIVAGRHGIPVAKVEPSLDSEVFCLSASEPRGDRPHVVAMVRPRTARRQPFSTVAVLERLIAEFPDTVEVTTFGCHRRELEKITRSPEILAGHAGLLKREAVARLLRRSDVFLDMSMYQAFGRTALEAMACGCTAVVPRLGGVWEFCEQRGNAIAVDTLDREAAFAAVAGLLGDPAELARLKSNAARSASRHSIVRAALSEYLVFEAAHRARFG